MKIRKHTVLFTLGAANGEDEARFLVRQSRDRMKAQTVLEGVWRYWGQTLGPACGNAGFVSELSG